MSAMPWRARDHECRRGSKVDGCGLPIGGSRCFQAVSDRSSTSPIRLTGHAGGETASTIGWPNPKHPCTNGQVERMNRTIKEATVKRYHFDSHDQLRGHIGDIVSAYNFARRLKSLTSRRMITSAASGQKSPRDPGFLRPQRSFPYYLEPSDVNLPDWNNSYVCCPNGQSTRRSHGDAPATCARSALLPKTVFHAGLKALLDTFTRSCKFMLTIAQGVRSCTFSRTKQACRGKILSPAGPW